MLHSCALRHILWYRRWMDGLDHKAYMLMTLLHAIAKWLHVATRSLIILTAAPKYLGWLLWMYTPAPKSLSTGWLLKKQTTLQWRNMSIVASQFNGTFAVYWTACHVITKGNPHYWFFARGIRRCFLSQSDHSISQWKAFTCHTICMILMKQRYVEFQLSGQTIIQSCDLTTEPLY